MKSTGKFKLDWDHAAYKYRGMASDIGNSVLAEIYKQMEDSPPQIEIDIDDKEPRLYISMVGDSSDGLVAYEMPISALRCVIHDMDATQQQHAHLYDVVINSLRQLADSVAAEKAALFS